MKLDKLNEEFGADAQNKIAEVNQNSMNGALACIETFYYSLNNKDINVLKQTWYDNDLIQLDNPLGGIIRGPKAITDLYSKLFNGKYKLTVKLTDIIYYMTNDIVVFAGTELGEFSSGDETIPLKIRTSRIFAYIDNEKRWFQIHHHGSIDDSDLLKKYQKAVKK